MLNDDSYPDRHIHLTDEQVPWDPENDDAGTLEESMLDTDNQLINDRPKDRTIMSLTQMENQYGHDLDFRCKTDLGIALRLNKQTIQVRSINSGECKTFIRSNQLAQ